MSLAAALFVAVAVGAGAWLLLRRNLFDVLLGVALLSQGVNLSLLASGGYRPDARPPVVATAAGATVDPAAYADPLPQALVLTAIVIGFGLLSFLAALAARRLETGGTLRPDGSGAGPEPGETP